MIGRSDEQQNPPDSLALRRREIVWCCLAEPIWTSGYPSHKQAGHMTAIASHIRTSFEEPLAPKGPSTHGSEPFFHA
jgi:hypothetical protein